jgi:hypothetical protein
MTEYSIKVNSSQGAVEVSGPEKEWVDAKLADLTSVFKDYRADVEETKSERAKARRGASAKKRAPERTSTSTQRRSRRATTRAERNADLAAKLTTDLKRDFGEYVEERRKAWDHAQTAQAAIIATFLQDRLQWEGVDASDLYTVYNAMGWRSPRNMPSQLTNARQRDRYFERVENGKAILSHHGENFGRHDSLNSTDGEDAS